MTQTIFASSAYEAVLHPRDADTVVVTFAERKEPPPAGFSGQVMLAKTDHAFCCIRSLANDWYVGADFPACLDAVARAVRPYRQVILYGFSMGSYGALIAAQALDADRLVLMAPVANIHPDKDRRWIADYEALIAGRSVADLAPAIPAGTEVICVYDPKGPDRRHVADLKRLCSVRDVLTPRAGHMVFTFLSNGGILGTVARMLFQPDVDVARAQALILSSKRNNSYYIAELARSLSRHPMLRRMLLRYGVRRFPADLALRLDYAGAIAESGQPAEAAAMIRAAVAEHPRTAVSVPVIRALGLYAEHGGGFDAVADLIAPYASDQPRAREVQLLYSRFLRHTGRFDQAFRAHEAFMKGGPFSAQGFVERGLIFEKLALPFLAETSYRAALAEAPDFRRAAQHLARLEQDHRAQKEK
ncbi:hypothetical protein [Paracoccus sediminis]|uniref:Alpha/beta hydrolase family protein n=1 Tax=Paracoccus sediminis TaxID=1214787 RepID=A0A238Y6Z5_9RHOB|nr:hypothetical protein [Paracoccus sediminis]SNR66423.1 hypothetical protein SAMN06265378_1159 [Paracoccus sediminis]